MLFFLCLVSSDAQVTQNTMAYYSFDHAEDKTVPSITGKFDGKLAGNAGIVVGSLQANALQIVNGKDYMVVECILYPDWDTNCTGNL
jgi:hypothetical protein